MKKKENQPQNTKTKENEVQKPVERKSKTLLYFVLRFAALFLLFEACYFNDYLFNHLFYPINKFFAFSTAKLLPVIGIHANSNAETIANNQFSITVKQGCDSLEALAIFICGVIAFPSKLNHKIYGLLIGSFVILFMNLIRLINLFWIGLYHRDLFDLFHLEIWQGFFILLSIALWLIWVLKAIKPSKPVSHVQ